MTQKCKQKKKPSSTVLPRGQPVRAGSRSDAAKDLTAQPRLQAARSRPALAGTCYLEENAVRPSTTTQYKRALRTLVLYCEAEAKNWRTLEQLDALLVDYFEAM